MNSTGLRVVVSNSPERLIEALLDDTADPGDPLRPDLVVVQTRAMERFLSLRMASRRGVCAGVKFPFPVALAYSLFKRVLPDAPRDEFFTQETLIWRILEVAPKVAASPEAVSLQSYLADGNDLKASQLASVLAGLFDQYLIFRPELIEAWERGESGGEERHATWQGLLWRAVTDGHESEHRVALRREFLRELAANRDIPGLPHRLSVFGVASLPPFYLDVFSALSKRFPVTVYQLGHCSNQSPAPMAAGLDTVGREFRQFLNGAGGRETALPMPQGSDTLLESLRRDLGYGLPDSGKTPVRDNDATVQFHSCHTAMREVEILHQNLLRLLQDNSDLEAREILVLCPDLSTYAPYVNAVFGSPPEDRFFIPYGMVGRALQEESPVVRSFLEVLNLSYERFELPAVLDLLQCAQVRRRFSLSGSDLPSLQAWFMEAGVRWGLDAQDRLELGLPGYREYTWEAALERLLLGYALPPEGYRLFLDTSPLDLVEGSRATLLDGGLGFCRTLFGFVLRLREKHTIQEWAVLLQDMLDSLFQECGDDGDEALGDLRQSFREMAEAAHTAESRRKVDLPAVREDLNRRLGDLSGGGRGFPGGVTFAPPGEMRQIPFRVVCMLGMNDAVFPRADVRPSFDLMARDRRLGDRSLREDDRRIFLEALLCTRDVLIVSYLGQSMEDNAPIPPSVLVSELMDHIEDHFTAPGGGSPLPSLIHIHRLQAFHPDYFRSGTGLFSFHGEPQPQEAAQEPEDPEGQVAAPAVRPSLPEAGEEWKAVDLSNLRAFLANPSKFYLERRLQLTLAADAALPLAEEPLTGLEGLETYALGQELLLGNGLAETDLPSLVTALTAAHRLPVGGLGGKLVDDLAAQARSLLRIKDTLTNGEKPLAPVTGEISTGKVTLYGRLQGLYSIGLVRLRLASIKAKDILAAWVDHLFLNALALGGNHPDLPRETWILGKNQKLLLTPEDKPLVLLADLLEVMGQGLRRPLPFFPRTSRDWSETLKSKGPDKARDNAETAWKGSPWTNQPGEGEDSHMGFCFPNSTCLAHKEFRELADRIWGPCMTREEKS